jgi:hypothetical protein
MNEELARKQAPQGDQEELKDEETGTALPSLPNKTVASTTSGGNVRMNQTSVAGLSVFDSERLLALSSLLRKGSREFEFFLQGKSMVPSLPDGSCIRVRLAADDQFIVGQVLTCVAKDRVVAHRLVRSVKSGNEEYLITRGDATVCCDWPVPATSLLGIVIGFSIPGVWQPVGPAPQRWFGFRWLAFLISSLVANILKVSPCAAVWTAKRIIRIHGMVERVMGWLK